MVKYVYESVYLSMAVVALPNWAFHHVGRAVVIRRKFFNDLVS